MADADPEVALLLLLAADADPVAAALSTPEAERTSALQAALEVRLGQSVRAELAATSRAAVVRRAADALALVVGSS